ncbi:MAG: universal stress protein [Acidimicrobiia bacterium]|nr:universal stress protein [Acidimicrobiia bacterium]MBV8986254.1 universal stress protein [Acidimicrobiia bacterium]MBV9041945.1 universal stress protein [Acidimicrobiia bacterium]MBV9284157.1 universal stress protein [Acidimicrobiia bacterium]
MPANKRIVVGTDGSPTATAAVRRAVELAVAEDASLHVVTAYRPKMGHEERALPEAWRWKASPGEVAEQTARAAAETAARAGVEVECHSRPGDPADVLVDVVDEVGADLLVIGNKGMRGAGRMVIPSIPNRVSHRAKCDILLVDTTAA